MDAVAGGTAESNPGLAAVAAAIDAGAGAEKESAGVRSIVRAS